MSFIDTIKADLAPDDGKVAIKWTDADGDHSELISPELYRALSKVAFDQEVKTQNLQKESE